MPEPVTEQVKDVSVADLLSAKPAESAASSASGTASAAETNEADHGGGENNAGGEVASGDHAEGQGGQEGLLTPTLKDRVAELGFKDVADDNDAQQRLVEAYQQQMEYQKQLSQQMEMMRLQMLMAQQQQKPAEQQATQQAGQQGWWKAPPINTQFRDQFIAGRKEDGSIEWKPTTPPQVMAEYEQEQAYYADWAQKLVRNPDQALKPFEDQILAAVEKKIQETIEQHSRKQQTETFVQQAIKENEDFLYQKDPVTKAIRYDFQGQPMLTEAGVRMDSILAELERSGMADETARWKYAQQIYKAQYGDLKQQQDQQVQQSRLAHFAKTTKPATHVPPRNGQDAVVNGRNQPLSMGQRFLATSGHDFSF